ncbi:helix-turn-helix transcriptional regulator [Nocardioides sp.]|uniref:helix-turn-helix transcriptional regulator n=1 Tax=Nocardioides sp. TaxID=35761 RepID=UPI003D0DE39B
MRKSERLMNLLIMLLVARRHLDKDHIRSYLYEGSSDDAFEKMFERDKDELRQLGIPIDMASQDAFFEDELGYRIHREAFELPDVALEADEAAVLGLAARVWQHAGLAGATSDAIVKLKAAGIAVDRSALDLVEPQLSAEEPSFDAFWSAAQRRTPVSFAYRRGGSAEVTQRQVQPWRVAWSSGRWYVLAFDIDRGAPRLFRLSRVQGEVLESGPEGSYELPTDVDFHALTRQLAPRAPRIEQTRVLVRAGAAIGLRRQAASSEEQVAGPDRTTGWDRLVIEGSSVDAMADEVLSFGADAYAEAPPALRDTVIQRLQGAAR